MQCTPENPCVAMQLLEQRMTVQEEGVEKMEALIESMRNRLPNWATWTLTVAGGTIGLLAGHVKF